MSEPQAPYGARGASAKFVRYPSPAMLGNAIRPEPGPVVERPEPGPGFCVFTHLLEWSKKFYSFHTCCGGGAGRELEAGMLAAILKAEEFLKD